MAFTIYGPPIMGTVGADVDFHVLVHGGEAVQFKASDDAGCFAIDSETGRVTGTLTKEHLGLRRYTIEATASDGSVATATGTVEVLGSPAPRDRLIQARVTGAEKHRLEKAAEDTGNTVSSLVREVVFEKIDGPDWISVTETGDIIITPPSVVEQTIPTETGHITITSPVTEEAVEQATTHNYGEAS